jgi:hypothetical protein
MGNYSEGRVTVGARVKTCDPGTCLTCGAKLSVYRLSGETLRAMSTCCSRLGLGSDALSALRAASLREPLGEALAASAEAARHLRMPGVKAPAQSGRSQPLGEATPSQQPPPKQPTTQTDPPAGRSHRGPFPYPARQAVTGQRAPSSGGEVTGRD